MSKAYYNNNFQTFYQSLYHHLHYLLFKYAEGEPRRGFLAMGGSSIANSIDK